MKNPFLENFRPFIPDSSKLRELTPLPLIVGTLLGIIFGASSLYLVLKTGLTVSASIPVAVIAITLFRYCLKLYADATILEANVCRRRAQPRVDRIRSRRDDARDPDPGL